MQIARRHFLAGCAVGLAACGRRKAEGFPGYAFVANRDGGAVAVVDLGVLAIVRHIRLDGGPAALVSHPKRPSVYALAPTEGTVHEINAERLILRRRVRLARSSVSMRLSPGGDALWVLSAAPRELVRLPVDTLKPDIRIPLQAVPVDFDISPDGNRAAISFGEQGTVGIVDLEDRRVVAHTDIGGSAGKLRYRGDGKLVLAANLSQSQLVVIQAGSGQLVVRLPLAVAPEHFCFKSDGGELFLTGAGLDAVVTVHPYQTEIASTTLAGRAPGFLAASVNPDYLFVANPQSGDVTILNIDTQRMVAAVPVGKRPCHITITQDNEYALVLNRDSGDMAVIRIATLTGRRRKSAPLFTMIPVGSAPVDAVVRGV